MRLNLKNYTSGVPPTRSVSRIEECLVAIGAAHINKTYNNGSLTGIMFQISDSNQNLSFKLPANAEAIEKMMTAQVRRPRRGTLDKVRNQAARTAWKLLLDWIEVQSSMIVIGRRSVMEVFLPYIYDGKRKQTFFEHMQETKFRLLSAP